MSKSSSPSQSDVRKAVQSFMTGIKKRNPGELEFQQAVHEVADSTMPYILEHPEYRKAQILEQMAEPERIIIFRVIWEGDDGTIRINRGWRVQFNSSIGPYKGGLRFHPSVNESILKFLGFEQTFKNALTGLPMGGAKGGSDFDPKGKSDREVMRFCHSFMIGLHRYIGADTDIPAGDIGVGAREIAYLFGMYKRLENRFTGAITGKSTEYGGSQIRPEATGYGTVYFTEHMLRHVGSSLNKRKVAVSGSGNVSTYAVEKAIEFGATVICMSDTGGFIHDADGIDEEKLAWIKDLKERRRGRIAEYVRKFPHAQFHENASPWSAGLPCDVALPCATQNEISGDDAKLMVKEGVMAVAEGANMPSNAAAIRVFQKAGVLFAPGKAANAGGVAVSGLEQSQNALRMSWPREEVDQKLQDIIRSIHAQCIEHGSEGEMVDYVKGANMAGFLKVAKAMLAYGIN